MKLKKYFNYYKATFPGEIQEKLKRKYLIKIGVFEKSQINKIPLDLEINLKFKEILDEAQSEIVSMNTLEDFFIFNQKISFEDKILDNNQNSKKWYLENIFSYRDIKITWEINRLQFLNYLVIKNQKEKAIKLLDEWIDKNPFNLGINWNNNLEIAIRSISIINFLFKVKDKKLLEKYKTEIFLHGVHIYNDICYTEKCIPNNHVIGEASALYCLGYLLDFNEKEKWISKAKQILEKYMFHFHEDGTYEEASLSYHRFTLQMYIMVLIFSNIVQDNFLNEKIKKTLKNSLVFFNSIQKTNGEYPDFGDNDEGQYFLVLNKRSFSDFVNSLKKIFNEKENYYGEIQELERIYNMKLKCPKIYESMNREFFDIGRYFCYKTYKNYIFTHNQNQVYHSHSDGMSLELVLEKKNILIDSGTFNYNIDHHKRKFYRGTKSHNTVWLGEDQSLQIGSFRWLNKLKQNLKVKKNKNKIYIDGEVITNKKVHKRNIKFNNELTEITIEDNIFNSNNFELNWIFSNEVTLDRINENKFIINPINYEMIILSEIELNIIMCKSFYSLKYNEENLGTTIKINSRWGKNSIKIFTIIRKRYEL